MPSLARAEGAATEGGPGLAIDNVVAFEGALQNIRQGSLELLVAGELRSIPLTPSTSVWKGGGVDFRALAGGDDVLVRLVDGQLSRAWANLVRRSGRVVRSSPTGFELATDESSGLDVAVNAQTRLIDAFYGSSVPWSGFPDGTSASPFPAEGP